MSLPERMKFGIFMGPFHRVGENPTLAIDRDLELVQRLRRQWLEPAFAGTSPDLRLPHRLYHLRKARPAAAAAREPDEVSRRLARRSTEAARAALDRLEKPSSADRGP